MQYSFGVTLRPSAARSNNLPEFIEPFHLAINNGEKVRANYFARARHRAGHEQVEEFVELAEFPIPGSFPLPPITRTRYSARRASSLLTFHRVWSSEYSIRRHVCVAPAQVCRALAEANDQWESLANLNSAPEFREAQQKLVPPFAIMPNSFLNSRVFRFGNNRLLLSARFLAVRCMRTRACLPAIFML